MRSVLAPLLFACSACSSTPPSECESAVRDLGGGTLFPGTSCTTTVRILAKTNAVLGWTVQCGEPKPTTVTESDARAAFDPLTGALVKAKDYKMLRDGSAGDSFVFYAMAGDIGGFSAVSARRGNVTFFADVIWGTGPSSHFNMPTSWRTGSETTSTCGFTEPPKLVAIPTEELTLDDARIAAVREVIGRSPILAALRTTHEPSSALLTVFPADLGFVTPYPTFAEYVVLIESSRKR